jgi:hypothetical protein
MGGDVQVLRLVNENFSGIERKPLMMYVIISWVSEEKLAHVLVAIAGLSFLFGSTNRVHRLLPVLMQRKTSNFEDLKN